MDNRRTSHDRRSYNYRMERSHKCNRRIRADRRLNNIKVEWIPISHIKLHPVTRLVFSKD